MIQGPTASSNGDFSETDQKVADNRAKLTFGSRSTPYKPPLNLWSSVSIGRSQPAANYGGSWPFSFESVVLKDVLSM